MTPKVWRSIAYHVGRFIGGMLMAAGLGVLIPSP